jgi:hypothetical protein
VVPVLPVEPVFGVLEVLVEVCEVPVELVLDVEGCSGVSCRAGTVPVSTSRGAFMAPAGGWITLTAAGASTC